MNNYQNTIYSTARATRGIKAPNETTSKSGFVRFCQKVFGNLTWYEYLWYATFFVAGIVCLCVFDFTPMLLVTVVSLYVYLISDNLTARGMAAGLFISIASGISYVVVCVITKVWGEVIANVVLYIPLDILAVYKWKHLKSKNDNHEKELAVTSFTITDWWFYLCFLGFCTVGVGLFLKEVLHQSTAFINAAGIFIYVAGMLARNQGKREMWLFYFAGDALSVTLWVMVALQGDMSTFPYCISSFASIFNSIIGVIAWQKLYKKNQQTTGEYLANSRTRINKIIKLRRQPQNLKWKGETDENWQTRGVKAHTKEESTGGNN